MIKLSVIKHIIFKNIPNYLFIGTCTAKPRPEDCTTYKRKECTTTSQTVCTNSGRRRRKKRQIDLAKNYAKRDALSRKKRTIDLALDLGKKIFNKKLKILRGIFGGGKKNTRPTSIVRPPSPPSNVVKPPGTSSNYYPSNSYPSSSYPSSSYPSSSFPSSNYPSAWYPSNSYPSNSYPSSSYPSSSYPSTISSTSTCYKVPKKTCKWVAYKQVCKKNPNCKPKPTVECKKECKKVYNCYECPDNKPTPIRYFLFYNSVYIFCISLFNQK